MVFVAVLVALLTAACTPQLARGRTTGHSRRTSPTVPSRPRSSPPRSAEPTGMRGQLVSRVIPGTSSGFSARPAFIYLPPALHRAPRDPWPVLVLLHGLPGGPADWAQAGGMARTMDAFAGKHGGRAPIVVMPDINGGRTADTECVDGSRGNAETYLTRDVPDYLRAHLPVSLSDRHWAIAGNSEGATCALMLGLRHPSLFSTIGFFSGLSRPTVGETDAPSATVAQLFGGSRSSYDHHDPLWLMRHDAYPTLAAWLECGSQDPPRVDSLASVAAAARHAAIPTVTHVVPGGHEWSVFRASLQQSMPWLWSRIG